MSPHSLQSHIQTATFKTTFLKNKQTISDLTPGCHNQSKAFTPLQTMAAAYEDYSDSDEEEEECRVCRGPAEEG